MADKADIVGRLARGSLFQRLLGPKRKPLRLIAVPRDHVEGDKRLGKALLSGTLVWGGEQIDLHDVDFGDVGVATPASRHLSTFAWHAIASSLQRPAGP